MIIAVLVGLVYVICAQYSENPYPPYPSQSDSPYGGGAVPPGPYGAAPPIPYGAPPAPYGAPPVPYGAPPGPYGAPPGPYGAPPGPYGAPPVPYGAPPAPYGAPPVPYGAPPAPYGAPPVPYGVPPPDYYPSPPVIYGPTYLPELPASHELLYPRRHHSRSSSSGDDCDNCHRVRVSCRNAHSSRCFTPRIKYLKRHCKGAVVTCDSNDDNVQLVTNNGDVLSDGLGISKFIKCRGGRWTANDIYGDRVRFRGLRCLEKPRRT